MAAIASGSDLRKARLVGAAPNEGPFGGVRLYEVKLRGVDLTGLSGGSLSRANLQGADLRGANLSGMYLTDAKLREADLRGAKYSAETKWSVGFDPVAAGAIWT